MKDFLLGVLKLGQGAIYDRAYIAPRPGEDAGRVVMGLGNDGGRLRSPPLTLGFQSLGFLAKSCHFALDLGSIFFAFSGYFGCLSNHG